MKKTHILKENTEFNRILNEIKPFRSKYFNIFIEKNTLDNYYYGFTVGKRIGNAVVRNKVKRRFKNILDQKKYKNGFKCIIMAKREVVDADFENVTSELLNTLARFDIFLD